MPALPPMCCPFRRPVIIAEARRGLAATPRPPLAAGSPAVKPACGTRWRRPWMIILSSGVSAAGFNRHHLSRYGDTSWDLGTIFARMSRAARRGPRIRRWRSACGVSLRTAERRDSGFRSRFPRRSGPAIRARRFSFVGAELGCCRSRPCGPGSSPSLRQASAQRAFQPVWSRSFSTIRIARIFPTQLCRSSPRRGSPSQVAATATPHRRTGTRACRRR